MTNSLWIPIVFSILITESMYHLLVIFIHAFSSIIMITFLLATSVRTKCWNLFAMDIPTLVSILMYNNFTSSILLVCNLNYNITSLIDLSRNSIFLNDHGILLHQETPISSRFDTILVIVNWLTKQMILIPTYNTVTFVGLSIFVCSSYVLQT